MCMVIFLFILCLLSQLIVDGCSAMAPTPYAFILTRPEHLYHHYLLSLMIFVADGTLVNHQINI
jgi:hypothetical protein